MTGSSTTSDYLFCGTCFLSFRLCDISVFIEHKKANCASHVNESSTQESSATDSLVATLLECVQCFQKFPTAWPLLLHFQFEHQLLLANTIQQHQANLTDSAGSYVVSSTKGLNPNARAEVVSDALEQIRSPPPTRVSSTATQTRLSSTGSQSMLRQARRVCPPCCASEPSVEKTCVITDRLGSNGYHSIPPSSDSYTVGKSCSCSCACISMKQSRQFVNSEAEKLLMVNSVSLCCATKTSSPLNGGYTSHTQPSHITESFQYSPQNNAMKKTGQTYSCCPCPNKEKPEVISSEVQTDFEPFVNSPDYADIAMLLASPSRSPAVDLDSFLKSDSEQIPLDGAPGNTESNDVMPSGIPHSVSDTNRFDITVLPVSQVTLSAPAIGDYLSSTETETVILDGDASRSDKFGLSETQTTLVSSQVCDNPEHPRFRCTQCGSVYNQKVHLKKHIMSQHIRRKPFSCHLCQYSTVEKSHLTVHLRTHTGERPFHCRICRYSSTQNCTLKSHYIRKHPTDFIQCIKCSVKFYTEQELSRHMRICSLYQ